MKESVKSLLLTLLVVCSLVQSYFLIYRLPGSDPVVKTESDYIKTENMGQGSDVESMLFPSQIAIHLAEDRHTIFYPESTFYNLIYSRLKGRQFDGFQRYALDNINWDEIRRNHTGLELEFDEGIPVVLLQRVMQIAPDPLFDVENINRILIHNTDTEDQVRVFFFSSQGDIVYEATKADLTVQDVRQQVDFGKEWVPYTLADGIYIPEQPVSMVETGLNVEMFTTDQMQSSLFFDPSITRYIREKDGSEIYTDSKRSLQVRQNRNWINFTDPAAPAAGENNSGRDVLTAVDFVNQHGGWNGLFHLNQSNGAGDGQHTIVFQQYYGTGPFGSLPIIDLPSFRYSEISLDMRQGTITGYERSLIYAAEGEWRKEIVELPGGDELRERLAAMEEGAKPLKLYPAYFPSLAQEGLLLKPVWAVKLSNGATRILY